MTSILVECKVCKKSVSKSALTCPHCGERLRMHPFTKFIVAILGIVGMILLVTIIMGMVFLFMAR